MTDIKELLTRAVDLPVSVDPHSDLRRGQARLRRRRVHLTGAVVAGVLSVSALAVAGHAVLPDRQRGGSSFSGSPGKQATTQQRADAAALLAQQQADKQAVEQSRLDSLKRSEAAQVRAANREAAKAARPHQSIDAAVVDPSTLVHTPYYDVPPAPAGWHIVGAQPEYVMIAPDGTDPALTGGFVGKLMVTHGLTSPQDDGTPIDFDGRTFYSRHDSGGRIVSVVLDSGDWLSVQWPETAGFAVSDMVAYLDAVQPLSGAVGAS